MVLIVPHIKQTSASSKILHKGEKVSGHPSCASFLLAGCVLIQNYYPPPPDSTVVQLSTGTTSEHSVVHVNHASLCVFVLWM